MILISSGAAILAKAQVPAKVMMQVTASPIALDAAMVLHVQHHLVYFAVERRSDERVVTDQSVGGLRVE